LETKDGISLLSLKHHIFLSYLQALVLVVSRQVLGDSLLGRTQPKSSFASEERGPRGSELGDLVDTMIEGRVILEKIKTLETRMRYQIEKLLRIAEERDNESGNVLNDPLAFRPDPQNLLDTKGQGASENAGAMEHSDNESNDGIYHPPRLAPMPYVEKRETQSRKDRLRLPSALASLTHSLADPSRPHVESASGLGSTPSLASARASQLMRMTEFEEENFTRLVMKKSDAKRRARDEAARALGADLGQGNRRHRGGGLEDEFGEVLRSVDMVSSARGGKGDGYDELRQKGKKQDVLKRRRSSSHFRTFGDEEGQVERMKKRSRFEVATKRARQKTKRRP